MKTFREYVTRDITNPYNQYSDGSGLLGPGMGQYHPVADLNANKHNNSKRQLLGPTKPRTGEKEVTKSDLDQIERYADRLFGSVGIDIEFTRHFLDRVNDVRNKMQITSAEITRLFKQSYKKFGKVIRKLGPDAQAVLTDMKTDINMPFVLNLKGGELELVAKTVMRKKDFKTSNPKLAFEDISEGRAKKAVAGGKVQKLVTAFGYSFKGKNYKEIDMELVGIDNSSQIVTFNIIHPAEIFGNEMKIPFRTLRRGRFMATDTSKINESRKTIKVGEDAVLGNGSPHYALVSDREVIATGTKEEMLELNLKVHGRVWLTKSNIGDIVEGIGEPNIFSQKNPRIPRKKGQPAGSDKHSDLYTDENPKGTIHGLGFKDVATAKASVSKIEGSGKSHAHKIQAAIAMEQRAKVMGKKAEAAIYRAYIEKMKKKTKEMQNEGIRMPAHGKQLKRDALKLGMKVNFTASGDFILLGKDEQTAKDHEKIAKKLGLKSHEYGKTSIGSRSTISKTIPKKLGENAHGFKCPPGYKFDRKLMACVPKKTRYKTVYAYPAFFGGTKSGDQSGQAQSGNGNGNGNGNGANGNGGNGNGGNGGNGNGGNGGGNGG